MSTPALSFDERSQLLINEQPRLRRLIFQTVRNAADRDDVLQDVNLVAWRKFDVFPRDTNFHAWCSRIAHLHVLKYRERRRLGAAPCESAELDDIAASGTDPAPSDPGRQLLLASIAALSPHDGHLVEASSGQRLRVARLSRFFQRPLSTVYRMLRCMRRQLRRSIDERISAHDETVT